MTIDELIKEEKLEPQTAIHGTSETVYLSSLAISLKRIADNLEKITGGDVPYCLSEYHFWLLGQSFGHGKGTA